MLLSDVATIINPRLSINDNHHDINGDIIHISPANITEKNELTFSNCRFVTSANFGDNDILQRDDIILVTAGSLNKIGNFFRYNLPMKAVISGNQSMFILRPMIPAEELVQILNRKYYNFKVLATEAAGAMMYRLRKQDLESFEIE